MYRKRINGFPVGVKVSPEDLYLGKLYCWEINPRGYVCGFPYISTPVPRRRVRLQRLVTNCPNGFVVHHISSDKLDNRRENLRITDQSWNAGESNHRHSNSTFCIYCRQKSRANHRCIRKCPTCLRRLAS